MTRSREEILRERRQLKAVYGAMFDEVVALLFRHDPAGISFDENTDEYEPEVGTILPRLRTCNSADEVRRIVHQEFVRWFDPVTAGPESAYSEIASGIWDLWQRYGSTINILPR
jgi:hypothetical protein